MTFRLNDMSRGRFDPDIPLKTGLAAHVPPHRASYAAERAKTVAKLIRGVLALAREEAPRLSAAMLLDAGGITPDDLQAAGSQNLSFDAYYRMLDLLQRTGGVPSAGLKLGAQRTLLDYGVFGYALFSCMNLRSCLRLIVLFFETTWDSVRIDCRIGDDFVEFQYKPAATLLHLTPILPELMVASSLAIIRELMPFAAWRDCELDFALRRPALDNEAVAMLPKRLRFDAPVTTLRMPASWLDVPFETADEITAQLCEEQCRRLLRSAKSTQPLSGQVRKVVMHASMGQIPTLETVALELKMSPRSLRRQLWEEDTSFRDILQAVRMESASRMLSSSGLPVQEVAYHLGFAHTSSFHRAFSRHFAQTPEQFRVDAKPV